MMLFNTSNPGVSRFGTKRTSLVSESPGCGYVVNSAAGMGWTAGVSGTVAIKRVASVGNRLSSGGGSTKGLECPVSVPFDDLLPSPKETFLGLVPFSSRALAGVLAVTSKPRLTVGFFGLLQAANRARSAVCLDPGFGLGTAGCFFGLAVSAGGFDFVLVARSLSFCLRSATSTGAVSFFTSLGGALENIYTNKS
jgi:hypothetical protein